jgi:hypothetical protein
MVSFAACGALLLLFVATRSAASAASALFVIAFFGRLVFAASAPALLGRFLVAVALPVVVVAVRTSGRL